MLSQKLNDWLQILGLFGVIGSLVFVGLQLKQTQDIALSETYQSRTAVTIDMNAAAMSSPEFLSGLSKIYLNKSDGLSMPEAVAVEWYIGTNLTVLENNHLQLQQGFLSQEHWQRNLRELECMLTVPFFREIADGWDYRETFEKLIADMMQDTPEDAENCWSYGWDFPMQ